MSVLESIENSRHHQSSLPFLCVLDGRELEKDEDVVWIVDAAEHALHLRLLSRAWPILVEHRPQGVVVPDLDPGDDEG